MVLDLMSHDPADVVQRTLRESVQVLRVENPSELFIQPRHLAIVPRVPGPPDGHESLEVLYLILRGFLLIFRSGSDAQVL